MLVANGIKSVAYLPTWIQLRARQDLFMNESAGDRSDHCFWYGYRQTRYPLRDPL
jgi:hypothetical protein